MLVTSEFAPEDMVGHRVLDTEGHNVGKVKQVYVDEQTGDPTWASVHTGMFGMKETLVPLQGAQPREEDIQVPYDKATVKEAPKVDADERLSPEDEALVRDYFARNAPVPPQAGSSESRAQEAQTGQEQSGGRTPGAFFDAREGRGDEPEMKEGSPVTAEEDITRRDQRFEGPDAGLGPTDERFDEQQETRSGATSDERVAPGRTEGDEEVAMIRHEEQVDIGVERRESGEATLHRHVDSEHFDETVPLHHEELEVERRPIDDPSEMVEDTDSREEASFTLHEERPVVSKKEVPVEEVRVRKRDVTRQEHVEGERRTERIELGEDDLDEEDDTRES